MHCRYFYTYTYIPILLRIFLPSTEEFKSNNKFVEHINLVNQGKTELYFPKHNENLYRQSQRQFRVM